MKLYTIQFLNLEKNIIRAKNRAQALRILAMNNINEKAIEEYKESYPDTPDEFAFSRCLESHLKLINNMKPIVEELQPLTANGIEWSKFGKYANSALNEIRAM